MENPGFFGESEKSVPEIDGSPIQCASFIYGRREGFTSRSSDRSTGTEGSCVSVRGSRTYLNSEGESSLFECDTGRNSVQPNMAVLQQLRHCPHTESCTVDQKPRLKVLDSSPMHCLLAQCKKERRYYVINRGILAVDERVKF